MLKIKFLILFLILSFFFPVKAISKNSIIKANSKIQKVTVYRDRALINRRAKINFKNIGRYTLCFKNLPQPLLNDSLRAEIEGKAKAKILGIKIKSFFLEKPKAKKISSLEEKLQELRDEYKALNDNLEVLRSEEEFLSSIKAISIDQIGKDIVTKLPKASSLENLTNFIFGKLFQIKKDIREISISQRSLSKKIRALELELDRIKKVCAMEEKEVRVELEVIKPGILFVNIYYLIYGANWRPIYDLRAYPDKKEVEITYLGEVRQATTEDWNKVSLTLSTAKPQIGATMPKLSPWWIDIYKSYYEKEKIKLFKAAPQLRREILKEEDKEVTLAKIEDIGTAVNFQIKKKEDIPSDNQGHKTTIAIDRIPCSFDYITTPKLREAAYLKANIKNPQEYPYLKGEVNCFLGENFVGSGNIKTIRPGEKFEITFGVDEEIKVKRKTLIEKTKVSLFGNKRTSIMSYQIELENYKEREILITVIDHKPLSKHSEIKIKEIKLDPKPDKVDERGICKWRFNLSPKEKKIIRLKFLVEYPANKNIIGLF